MNKHNNTAYAALPEPTTGHAEADRLISRLMSSDPDFEDCLQAAALIQQEIKGPDGYGTWREAAIAERQQRVIASREQVPAGAGESAYDPCGGCGEDDPKKRCLGCMHPFTPTPLPTEAPTIDVMIHDLRGLYQQTTRGVWGKGRSSHQTVARCPDAEPYKVAEFRHANDAAFCDAAHTFIPALLDELERRTPSPVGVEPVAWRVPQVDAAAKALAECMDYPWEHMPETGRQAMREHAQKVLSAAHGIQQYKDKYDF